ncbi:MAG: McrC family protein [Atopobiaceae bacterium]|nr:McrC family protein [Atopobiaceae bacterium]
MARREPIQAREYDYLITGSGGGNCHHLNKDEFTALREFVLENRSDDEDNPRELMRLCSLRGAGEAIQLLNYVGVVELQDGTQIEILPKIEIAHGAEGEDRRVFLRMLRELGSSISFKSLNNARLMADRAPLFEVFVAMFIAEASSLVRTGLRSGYVARHSEEGFVRGKIDFSREVKSGLAHAERIHVIHDEFLVDRPENRLVKTTLIYLRGASRSSENVRAIRRLLSVFEEVGRSHNVDADFARCVRSRETAAYQNLLSWSPVFLKHESFTTFSGQSVVSALLFPMERVFEDYVGHVLRRTAYAEGRLNKVLLQAQSEWLFERKAPLRPDILCECLGGRRVVLDTKWKRVTSERDLSTADLYQMYAYGKRFATTDEQMQHVVLLYPWHKEATRGLFREARHTSNDGVQVDVFFVDLEDMDGSMQELLALIEDPQRLSDGVDKELRFEKRSRGRPCRTGTRAT